jgi:TetR/AcrR family transcriptional regulator, transcriptional repressor for nem operon
MVRARQGGRTDTAAEILDVAERLVQIRGFNGVSYGDIAGELSITTAALHYHFANKAELGEALVSRYAARFGEALAAIDASGYDAPARLEAYSSLYLDVLRNERMCLCGMLAADYQTLPQPMRDAVIRFFDENERWVASVLEQGRAHGTLHFDGSPSAVAQMIVGGLEGAMLIARSYGDAERFRSAAQQLLESITTPSPS